ncbi:MAG: 6-bladed beta-propeller [Thermomicrobiales bacterium]
MARFGLMTGIAVRESGNVFVADGALDRIQMFSPTGNHLLTWGEEGSGEEQIDDPRGLEIDDKGFLYIADYGNDRVQVFTTDGEYARSFGSSGRYPGQFEGPVDITSDQYDNVYITGAGDALIHMFTYRGEYLDRWGNDYRTSFGRPAGIVENSDGYIYVADELHGQVKIISYDGEFDGIIKHEFDRPVDVTFYNDYVYVLDAGYRSVLVFDATGEYIGGWGNLLLNGIPDEGYETFDNPSAIVADNDGYIYIVNSGNYLIQKFTWEGEYVTAWGSYGDGPGQFKDPYGVAVWNDYVYVTDRETHRVQVFDQDGEYIRSWGDYGSDYGYFDEPSGIDTDDDGNIYVADTGNDRIQKFTYDGEYVTSLNSYNTDVPEGGRPVGIDAGYEGRLYATSENHYAVYVFEPDEKE